uniref:hypothetical protein n=1 Tax=Burkholderia cepacia TaxID=292 RepID=UPI002990288E|nr:hypothetical protein [Burkholderia cepacia]
MEQAEVILGIDTHLDVHVGAVISETGKLLGTRSVSSNSSGYIDLLIWAKSLGNLRRAGMEGNGRVIAQLRARFRSFAQSNSVSRIGIDAVCVVGSPHGYRRRAPPASRSYASADRGLQPTIVLPSSNGCQIAVAIIVLLVDEMRGAAERGDWPSARWLAD